MWMNVAINGETAGAHISPDMHGNQTIAPEFHADIFEDVTVENGTVGDVNCTACGERFDDESDAEDQHCPDSDDNAHKIQDAPLSWFTNAKIVVDEEHDEVRLNVSTGASTLQMVVRRLDNGEIVIYMPETDRHHLVPFGSGYLVVNP